jgi:hypothetical protein
MFTYYLTHVYLAPYMSQGTSVDFPQPSHFCSLCVTAFPPLLYSRGTTVHRQPHYPSTHVTPSPACYMPSRDTTRHSSTQEQFRSGGDGLCVTACTTYWFFRNVGQHSPSATQSHSPEDRTTNATLPLRHIHYCSSEPKAA